MVHMTIRLRIEAFTFFAILNKRHARPASWRLCERHLKLLLLESRELQKNVLNG